MKPLTEHRAHCRICGYTPRPPKAGKPDFTFERIIEHLESRHPAEVLGTVSEFQILCSQLQGVEVER